MLNDREKFLFEPVILPVSFSFVPDKNQRKQNGNHIELGNTFMESNDGQ